MFESANHSPHAGKIALIGNYLPRRCGIATFTTDLLNALAEENTKGECWAVVMNDTANGYLYPPQVRFEINQHILPEYRLAADFLNMNRVEGVCLQHEFGIFGGNDGSYVLELLSHLQKPVVTTLHTVLQEPTREQMRIIKSIARLSGRVVVMSHRAVQILQNVYGIEAEKIAVIHHGIPDVAFVDPNFYKDQYGVEGRRVILTFGLLSPNKGIETMIDALPAVVSAYPDVVYIVLGSTHPNVKREQGEAYRLSLQRRARDLGVGEHLIFHNRFVDLKELTEFLGATDIYVTPYLNREQIVSGTLAYAMGSGKATISTPYWYAEEMLADDRGRLVPFKDADAFAAQINNLFENPLERHSLRKRAYSFCRNMIWKEVARRYLEVLEGIKQERQSFPRPVFLPKSMTAASRGLPQPKLDHIIRLTDGVGILQHATFIVPNRWHGYCVDDNARAMIAVMMAQETIIDAEAVTNLVCTYIGFLHHAFNEETGRFRNFMGYERQWLETVGAEDSHGRAVWALGVTVKLSASENIRAAAQELLETALPALLDFTSPRAWAFALVGIQAYLTHFSGDSEVRRIREDLAERLMRQYQQNATSDWPWIEDIVTYANGKISQALILSGRYLKNDGMLEAGLSSLEWLLDIQTDKSGHFVPVGNNGWYPRGGKKARFDQQPIETLDVIEACREAYEATGDSKWVEHAHHCFEWFLGRNDLNAALYDHKTGGCCDGLGSDGPNRNQGAESTLVCFLSILHLNRLRTRQISMETIEGAQPEN
ncbi:MAG: glycosyltransferase family 4 protein [Desulfobacterales bacterium]|nr:glycosyltransferase family 4 protein [Desulfobacterales bacterium]